ncbi:hypothetical protein EDD66_105162 [Mobilisporobacter senegalensis]|uniref:Uncharacterized protein n=1 Tax=Mobilisporobacter senegalensis TaxID=1329262 RepID=A0A3N1XNF3_9FIRM|nr:hypothetical protein [Mobilisporobacter senegalensis]ROR28223.1 hypothetical protein EDD66_105162 [Mobilisporobacter senegalensis]
MKNKRVVIFVTIILMISGMIITDRVRFNNKKTPIFAVSIIRAYDVDIYTGFGYSIIYGHKGDVLVSEWNWGYLF